MMKAMRVEQQRDLFEVNDPPIILCEQHKYRLLPLVQAMLLEILARLSQLDPDFRNFAPS